MTAHRTTRTRAHLLLALVAGAVLVSIGVADALERPTRGDFAGSEVSPVIFGHQQIPLAFSHVQHIQLKKLNCEFCHENAPDSRSSVDNLIPTEEQCAICHEIERSQPNKQVAAGQPDAACASCHVGFQAGQPVARVVIPNPNIKFNHARHVELKVDCETCHGDLASEQVELATREHLPKMRLCLQCHDGRQAPSACTTCHLADPGGMVKTHYAGGVLSPSGVLRGDAHDAGFSRDHARLAHNNPGYCDNCHRKEYCIGCHNGTVKPMEFHLGDYVTLHPIEARRNNPDCSACHRLQTFCTGCHSRSGVANDGRGSEFLPASSLDDSRRFHPQGWVEFGSGGGLITGEDSRGPNHHSFQAQRNIKQCAACHREQFCLDCHSAEPGSFRINPHPFDWVGSRRCKALLARAGRMCLRCHTDVQEVRCDMPM